jgi:hypothetical protein
MTRERIGFFSVVAGRSIEFSPPPAAGKKELANRIPKSTQVVFSDQADRVIF